jgi:hypothetical protein
VCIKRINENNVTFSEKEKEKKREGKRHHASKIARTLPSLYSNLTAHSIVKNARSNTKLFHIHLFLCIHIYYIILKDTMGRFL